MKNKLLEMTSKLIEFRSVTGDVEETGKLIEYVKSYCEGAGLLIKRFDFNNKPSLVVTLGKQKPQLILNGHADVVPAKPEQFEPKIVGDKLYGRGAQDMKSGLACMIELMCDLKKQNLDLPVGLMIVTDEEVGGFDGSKKLLHEAGYKPDFFIAGESTDLKIEYEAKGITWLKIKTKGQRAHGAYLWEGKNAIHKLVNDVLSIYKIYPEPEEYIWKTTCNIGKISGGLANNQVPGEAEMVLDIRRIPQESTELIVGKIKSALQNTDTEVEILLDEPAHSADKNNHGIKLLGQTIQKYTQKPTEYIRKCGASDARHFSAAGTTAVCFGPAGSGLHTDDEYLEISSLEIYYQILKDFVLMLK